MGLTLTGWSGRRGSSRPTG